MLGLVRFGGKARLAPYIMGLINATNCSIYCEPFGGGGRVMYLAAMSDRFDKLIISDIDQDIYDYLKTVSNYESVKKMIRIILNEMPCTKDCFEMLKRTDFSDNQIVNAAKTMFI